MGAGSGRFGEQARLALAVNDIAKESVEHEQRPERSAVVACAGLVAVDELAQVSSLEEPRVRERVRSSLLGERARAADRGTSAPAEP